MTSPEPTKKIKLRPGPYWPRSERMRVEEAKKGWTSIKWLNITIIGRTKSREFEVRSKTSQSYQKKGPHDLWRAVLASAVDPESAFSANQSVVRS